MIDHINPQIQILTVELKEYGDEYENKFGLLESIVNNNEAINNKTLGNIENVKKESSIVYASSSQSFGDCMVSELKDHFGVALITAALEGGL